MEPIPSSPCSSSTLSYQSSEEQVDKILNLFVESEHHLRKKKEHSQLHLSKRSEARQNIRLLDGRGLYEAALALQRKGKEFDSEVKWLLGLSAELIYPPSFAARIKLFPDNPENRLYELYDSIVNNSHGPNYEGPHNLISSYYGTDLFFKTLRVNHTITHLNLKNMWLGDYGTEFLASTLSCNSTITKLNLSSNHFSSGEYLAPVLRCHSTITSLDLSSNRIHCEFLSQIFQNSTITDLNLQNCYIDDAMAESISIMLKEGNSSLRTLNLNHNRIEKGACSIAEALMINSSLTKLSFASNCIDTFAMFFKNSTLASLDLSGNKLSEEAVSEISLELCSNSTLTELDLAVTCLRCSGAGLLADALCINSTLTILNVNLNNIKNEGMRHFTRALKSNTTLTALNLEMNSMSGGNDIADLINSSSSLLTLKLVGNSLLLKEVCERENVARALSNSFLMDCTLDYCEISGYTHLLQHNTTLTKLNLGSQDTEVGEILIRNARLNLTLYQLLLPQVYE